MSPLVSFSRNLTSNRKKKHARKLSIALFCLFMLPVARAQDGVPIHPDDRAYIKLSSDELKDEIWLDGRLWKYHQGDNAEWATPEFDDSEWEITNSRLNPNNLPKSGWNGIGWFRLHLVVDSTLWNRPLALNVRQGGASEIYLDGFLVAQFGKVGSSKRDEEGYITRNADFLPPPQSIIFSKTAHVIAVRFSNFHLVETYPRQLSHGFEIVLSDLASAIASSASQMRVATIIQMVITIVPIVLAILHLLLFLFYQRAKENLYYALFTSMLGTVFFTVYQIEFSLVTGLQLALPLLKLANAIFIFLLIAGLRFLYALFCPRLPKQFWAFLLIASGLNAWDLAQPYNDNILRTLFVIVALLEMLRVTTVAIRRKKDGAWIIGAGFIFFTVVMSWATFYDLLASMNILPNFEENLGIILFSPAIFGLLLSMSVYLSRNFANTHKNLERQSVALRQLNLELEDRVKKRTAELAEANNALEMKNAQLTDSYRELDSAHTQLQKTQTRLVQSEKMAALGKLTAGILHEVNNPVAALKSTVDTMSRSGTNLDQIVENSNTLEELKNNKVYQKSLKILKENGQIVSSASKRIIEVVTNLKSFIRLDDAKFAKTDIHEALNTTLTLLRHEMEDRVRIDKQYGDIPEIRCYPAELNQVFMTLLRKAAQAIEKKGTITIETSSDENNVYVHILDTGKGIPQDKIKTLFDLNFTTKDARVAMDMGLVNAYNIIQNHKGELKVESEVEKGSTFTIILPVDLNETTKAV